MCCLLLVMGTRDSTEDKRFWVDGWMDGWMDELVDGWIDDRWIVL